ncbi:MAG: response regulator [Candidatus Omnitrophota bacterium]|jgi:CheY-like chemotaxis protein|nr:MAG: response regulator [Candidatus Omnitrophota bacterium]
MNTEKKKARLLIVDDEIDFRKAASQGLSRRGFDVSEAASGDECLQVIREQIPDIVLLDQKMPGMSGIETLKEIRKICENLPVIMLTGHGNYDTALAGIHLEIVDFIQKPVDIEQLCTHIHDLSARNIDNQMREPVIAELMAPADLYPKVYDDEPLTSLLKAISDAYRKPIPENSKYGQVRSARVYNRAEEFQGMIRFSDLLKLLIPDALRDSPYATFYTGMLLAQSKVFGKQTIKGLLRPKVCVDVDAPLMEAVHLMVDNKLINIPVVQQSRLMGILRGRDVIIATARLAGIKL